MKASIIVAAHNEGDLLLRTIESCVETSAGLNYEILVIDDASTDGAPETAARRFPTIRLHRHSSRQGASPTKHHGAREARGDVLVFLDAHAKPEFGSLARLVRAVDETGGRTAVTPRIVALDADRWQNVLAQSGHGYAFDLLTMESRWVPLEGLQRSPLGRGNLYESAALIGCAFAVSRAAYDSVWGFDPQMRYWGVEDLDFSLKCWLMGYAIVHDPEVIIGHRFQDSFQGYAVPAEHVVANSLRMAYKHYTYGVWNAWVELAAQHHAESLPGHPEGLWARAWELFRSGEESARQERSYLHGHRVHDEFWYAERFGLSWPRLAGAAERAAMLPRAGSPSPSPSPRPVTVEIIVQNAIVTLGQTDNLRARVTPSSPAPTNYKFEVKRRRGAAWTTLANGPNSTFNWPTRVAGFMNVRVTATVAGVDRVSPQKDVEVQFPAFSDVVGNADVQAATDASWASTKAATTPTTRREEGFWIQIDTTAVTRYRRTATVLGPVVDPTHTGSVDLGPRPADNPATPDLRTGGVFAVASFHTHTPTTFRAVGRPVGPSAADNAADLHDDVTGVVYDYVETPAGSGSIPAGHPLDSAARRYLSGPNRRSTPP
jgi:glycosyltransferase involved in cell wall biosynthesis